MDTYRVTIQAVITYTGIVFDTNPASWDGKRVGRYVVEDNKWVQKTDEKLVVTKVEQLGVTGTLYEDGM